MLFPPSEPVIPSSTDSVSPDAGFMPSGPLHFMERRKSLPSDSIPSTRRLPPHFFRFHLLLLIPQPVSQSAGSRRGNAGHQIIQKGVDLAVFLGIQPPDHPELLFVQMAEGRDSNAAVSENRSQRQGFVATKQAFIRFHQGLKGLRQTPFFGQLIQFHADENRVLYLSLLQNRQHALHAMIHGQRLTVGCLHPVNDLRNLLDRHSPLAQPFQDGFLDFLTVNLSSFHPIHSFSLCPCEFLGRIFFIIPQFGSEMSYTTESLSRNSVGV